MNSGSEKVKFLLNWNRFPEHLSSCLTKLMTDVSYSDVIIATADKHMIYAHRFVLANSSKYFQRLLKQINRQKNAQLVVALPEIKYEIFKILMNYMYKGETQVPHELLPAVIKAGQLLEINGLVDLTEGESNSKDASLIKFNSNEGHSRSTIIHSPKGIPDGKRNEVLRIKKHFIQKQAAVQAKKRRAEIDIDSTSESITEESRKKPVVINKSQLEKKEISLPIKRRVIKDPSFNRVVMEKEKEKEKEKERPSSSTENAIKKPIKKSFPVQEVTPITIKSEKVESWENVSQNQEIQDVEDEITIKTEAPDDVEEIGYNELQCDYCQQTYSNPSDWVRHMTEHHSDRGYQTYKEFERDVNADAVYTCVICSSVLFSAADWARHLRIWHTDKELAAANSVAASKKGDEDSENGMTNNSKAGAERGPIKKK